MTRPSVTPKKTSAGWRTVEDGVEAIYLPTWLRYRALTVNPRVIGFVGPRLVRRSIEPYPTALWHAFGVDAALFVPGYLVPPWGRSLRSATQF
jgi:hypothetical protein